MTELFVRTKGPAPLSERVRPFNFEDLIGLESVVGENTPFGSQIREDSLSSTILWGPAGSGKTTIARIIAKRTKNSFSSLSAVLSSIKEVKEVMSRAKKEWEYEGKSTILFIDEIHRYNKAQQDAFLPYLEEGSVVLLGTTTENPSFHLTEALLSRCQVVVIPNLSKDSIKKILTNALDKDEKLKGICPEKVEENLLEIFAELSLGDARFALNALESYILYYPKNRKKDPKSVVDWLSKSKIIYDRSGEEHYNLISALHKSIRNSDPDAALYYLYRMLEGGEDPLYIARRLVRVAIEDIGNADPAALRVALSAKEAVDFLGMPECDLALAQTVVYLCASPKSNSLYIAASEIKNDLRKGKRYPVPLHLRNAPTKLMEDLGYGKDYIYAHEEEKGIAKMECLPPELKGRKYYSPKETGYEKKIKEWLDMWKKRKENI
ncbi:MAG: replication-associated recombination protein A [Acidobacteria bacterium]|nr:replication-associated recombination protein A [Acidobacteriota bacterium]